MKNNNKNSSLPADAAPPAASAEIPATPSAELPASVADASPEEPQETLASLRDKVFALHSDVRERDEAIKGLTEQSAQLEKQIDEATQKLFDTGQKAIDRGEKNEKLHEENEGLRTQIAQLTQSIQLGPNPDKQLVADMDELRQKLDTVKSELAAEKGVHAETVKIYEETVAELRAQVAGLTKANDEVSNLNGKMALQMKELKLDRAAPLAGSAKNVKPRTVTDILRGQLDQIRESVVELNRLSPSSEADEALMRLTRTGNLLIDVYAQRNL